MFSVNIRRHACTKGEIIPQWALSGCYCSCAQYFLSSWFSIKSSIDLSTISLEDNLPTNTDHIYFAFQQVKKTASFTDLNKNTCMLMLNVTNPAKISKWKKLIFLQLSIHLIKVISRTCILHKAYFILTTLFSNICIRIGILSVTIPLHWKYIKQCFCTNCFRLL